MKYIFFICLSLTGFYVHGRSCDHPKLLGHLQAVGNGFNCQGLENCQATVDVVSSHLRKIVVYYQHLRDLGGQCVSWEIVSSARDAAKVLCNEFEVGYTPKILKMMNDLKMATNYVMPTLIRLQKENASDTNFISCNSRITR